MTLHWTRLSVAARRAFCDVYIRSSLFDSDPQLTFLAHGGEGAMVAVQIPRQQVHSEVYSSAGIQYVEGLVAALPPQLPLRWPPAADVPGVFFPRRRGHDRGGAAATASAATSAIWNINLCLLQGSKGSLAAAAIHVLH